MLCTKKPASEANHWQAFLCYTGAMDELIALIPQKYSSITIMSFSGKFQIQLNCGTGLLDWHKVVDDCCLSASGDTLDEVVEVMRGVVL